TFYGDALRPAIPPLLAAALFIVWFRRRGSTDSGKQRGVFPTEELAVVIGFAAIPLIVIALAMSSPSFGYAPRYGVLSVIGMSCWIPAMLFRTTPDSRSGVIVVCAVVGFLLFGRGREVVAARPSMERQIMQDYGLVQGALRDGRPVVVIEQIVFLELDY